MTGWTCVCCVFVRGLKLVKGTNVVVHALMKRFSEIYKITPAKQPLVSGEMF